MAKFVSRELAPTNAHHNASFYLYHAGIPALAALLLLIIFKFSNLDDVVTGMFYDTARHQFPLRHGWFLDAVLHRWAKYLLILAACLILGGLFLSYGLPNLRAQRAALLFVFLTMTLGPLVAAGLRHISREYCPHELTQYGGYAVPGEHYHGTYAAVRRRGCFPDDHAAGGFGLMAFYLVCYRRRRRLAQGALGAGVAYGLVLGLGRVMQGAHFLSDSLWAAVICWFIALILYRLILDRKSTPSDD